MNQKTALGLGIVAALVIIVGILWWLYFAGPPRVGPGPEATSKPPVAPSPAATPEPKQPAQPEAPVAPPITTAPSQGVAPLQEPSAPAAKITIPLPPDMKEHFGILAGEYPNYRDAAKLLAKLKKQGKPAFVQRDPKNPNNFQVWLGPFDSQAEAQAAAKDLQAKFKKPLKIEQIENPVPK